MACLDEQLAHMKALVKVFETADRPTVLRAVDAVAALPGAAACANVSALRERRPTDPQAAAAIDALSGEVARIDALMDAARYREALPATRTLAETAAKIGHGPFRAL